MTILVTGGAGFIGANFVLDWLAQTSDPVINLDKVTYAGNLEILAPLQGDARHAFVQGDIGHGALVSSLQSPVCWLSISPGPYSTSLPKAT